MSICCMSKMQIIIIDVQCTLQRGLFCFNLCTHIQHTYISVGLDLLLKNHNVDNNCYLQYKMNN